MGDDGACETRGVEWKEMKMMKFRRRGQQVPPAPGGSSPRRPARQDARLQIQDVLPGRIRPAPARGSSPPGRHVGPDRGRGASLRSAAGQGGWRRGERQPFVERPELPGSRRPAAGHRPMPRLRPMPWLIDASTTATGARERPGERGGYLDDAAASAFWPKDQEGGARRRTGGGSRSQTSRPWPLHHRRAGPSQLIGFHSPRIPL